ncbi:MAG: hypothetical protein NWR69_09575 [Flavobacteriales bacterium]|nr:hypothetical protein [Flavobacteriales bacterium]MDP4819247.1 hypothetical protein [Flavobacteriales bacterium]
MKRAKYILILAFVSGFSIVKAQVLDSTLNSINKLYALWEKGYAQSKEQLTWSDFKTAEAAWPVIVDQTSVDIQKHIYESYTLRTNIMRADKGLSVVSNNQYNFDTQYDEDDIWFRARYINGIEWDILSGGLVENKRRAQILENELQMKLLENKNSNSGKISYENRNQIIYYFNKKKVEVLKARLEISNNKMDILTDLAESGEIRTTMLLEAHKQMIEINGQFNLYASFNDGLKTMLDTNRITTKRLLPPFDVNVVSLRALSGMQFNPNKKMELQAKNDKLRYNWLNEVDLTTGVRYNYYQRLGDGFDRGFMSANLNARIPLRIFQMDYLALTRLQQEEVKLTMRQEDELRWLEISNLVYELRYKQKQFSNMLEKQRLHHDLLKNFQGLKKIDDPSFQPIVGLNALDEFWAMEIEKIDLLQQMYLKLGEIQEKIPNEAISQYIVPWNGNMSIIEGTEDSAYVAENRSMYLWSKAWMDKSSTEIITNVRIWNVQKLLISAGGSEAHWPQFKQLVNMAERNELKCELLIGNNRWLSSNMTTKLDSVWSKIAELPIEGIHLDLEVHTFDGFKDSPEAFFLLYMNRVREASAFCKIHNLRLEVSIPLTYPAEVIQELEMLCDEIVVMAYETKGPKQIQNRIAEELIIGKDKISVALRAKDYVSKASMENDFRELKGLIKVKNTVLHDYQTYKILNQ